MHGARTRLGPARCARSAGATACTSIGLTLLVGVMALMGMIGMTGMTGINATARGLEAPQSTTVASSFNETTADGVASVPGAKAICAPGMLDRPPTSGAGVTAIFGADSPPTESIRQLAWLVLGICAAIFVVVEAMLVIAVVRFRRRQRDEGLRESEPTQLYGSNPIELAWTIVPLLIVFVLGLVTIRTIREVQLTEPPEGSLRVQVIGHQWWWEYRFPDELGDGREVVTANELVVPVDRPVWLELESADVVHSWWVPRLAGKTDCVPGRTNVTWFEARRPGLYLGQCAEYCGTQHANMLLRVRAMPPQEFRAWLEHQATPAVVDDAVASGRQLFAAFACLNCHAIDGVSAGMFGPNLTHLASRETIGSGIVPLTRENLRAWIADPQTMKIGCNMPSLKLDDRELDLITDYLMTLR